MSKMKNLRRSLNKRKKMMEFRKRQKEKGEMIE
jgi:hypothetical protein